MDRVIIAGASRGIGAAVAAHLVPMVREVITVSRTPAPFGTWIKADLSEPEGIRAVTGAVGGATLDALLYMGGTWEQHAFSREYDFATCSDADIVRVLNLNLLAPIRLTQALLPRLDAAPNPKIVFMGSIVGRESFPAREVANNASKFGLRGVVHALREVSRDRRIGVSVINPANVATPEVLRDLAAGTLTGGGAIPMADLLAVLDCVLAMSRSTCIKEIDVLAMDTIGA